MYEFGIYCFLINISEYSVKNTKFIVSVKLLSMSYEHFRSDTVQLRVVIRNTDMIKT